MSTVKLLICYHKPATLFKDEILTPIHVGRANARKKSGPNDKNFQWMMDNMIGDDTGENISERNSSYNELTSLYWAWKNYDQLGNPDYVGLMHYRRHFVLREDEFYVYNVDNFNEESYLQEINYSPEKMNELIEGCDFVTHIGKVMNVYNHYIENHRKEDLDLAVEIMLKKFPKYEAVTKEYFAGDYSNFCNMFIFNKKIFFEYCEWIFSILEEFEKHVDTSEKRFFISERLTGIFVANLMKNKKLKYKVLPISFIDDPVRIPIIMPVNTGNIYQTANTMTSILEAAKEKNSFQFYLLYGGETKKKDLDKFKCFDEKYICCKTCFIKMEMEEEYYPLYVSELLKKEQKCIYLSGDVLALQDLGEFYRTCSTDDYFVVGAPLGKYDVLQEEKELSFSILVLNCARLRQHKMWQEAQEKIKEGIDGTKIFSTLCKGQVGYIPWYFVTRESQYEYKNNVLADSKPRGQIQLEATWRAWMVYDSLAPWINNQGVYSIFWWDIAVKVPTNFNFVPMNAKELQILYAKQQKEINESLDRTLQNWTPPAEEVSPIQTRQEGKEEWRSYSLFGKLRFFYQHNGLKKTITYSCGKVVKILAGKERISHD